MTSFGATEVVNNTANSLKMRGYLIILGISLWISFVIAYYIFDNYESDKCGQLFSRDLYNLETNLRRRELPWIARIVYTPGVRKECMATLINYSYFISLAHCVVDQSYRGVLFAIDQGTRYDCTQTDSLECPIRIIEKIFHPHYETPYPPFNVTALLRLKHSMFANDVEHPICLPPAEVIKKDFVAQHLLTAGLTVYSKRYTKSYVYIVDKEMCFKTYDSSETSLCANTCHNGSKFKPGTALMGVHVTQSKADFHYLIGMLVLSREYCINYKPDLFVRINITWIQETITEDAASLPEYRRNHHFTNGF